MASSIPVLRVLIRDLAAKEAARLQARLARREATTARPTPGASRGPWKDQPSLLSRPQDLEPILLRKPWTKGDGEEFADQGSRRPTKNSSRKQRVRWVDGLAVNIPRSPDSSYGPWSPRSPHSPRSPRRPGDAWRQP